MPGIKPAALKTLNQPPYNFPKPSLLPQNACKMRGMDAYLAIFEGLKAARTGDMLKQHGLMIKTGTGLGAAILKLLKPAWTTDGPAEILNSNGLFFGVWVDAACVAQGRARFNVHAKKLRLVKGEAFAAREFARAFRIEANEALKAWPNCSYPKGPITLFEGHFALDPATLAAETTRLMDRFAALTPMLDRMISSPAKPLD